MIRIGILGDIGSGKSTVLKIILGLIKPDHGEFKINNKLIENSNLLKNLYSYVPQNPFFFNDSILNNLTYFLLKITFFFLNIIQKNLCMIGLKTQNLSIKGIYFLKFILSIQEQS